MMTKITAIMKNSGTPGETLAFWRRPGSTHRRWRRESDAAIGCDRVRDEASDEQDGVVVVRLPEIWNRLAAERADLAVRKNGLKTVADLESIFVIVDGEQHQDAAIGFRPDAELRREIDGIVLDGRSPSDLMVTTAICACVFCWTSVQRAVSCAFADGLRTPARSVT